MIIIPNMKNRLTQEAQTWLRSAFCGLLLTGSTTAVLAVPDRTLNTFDAGIAGVGNAWGGASYVFDAVEDNTGNAGGSVYVSSDFAADNNTLTMFCNEPPNGAWYFPGPAFNLSSYASVDFDIKWDNTKTLSIADFNSPPAGGEGGIAIWATDYPSFTNRPTVGVIQVPAAAASGWAHVSLPINPATAAIDPSVGIVFKKWIADPQKVAGGTYGFWVDNVVLKGAAAPPPPPSVSLVKPVPGLAFVAASAGQYDRQDIRTVGTSYSWVGASGPVSYSIDVSKIGESNPAGFQLFMHLVPGIPTANRADSDWHEPNVVMWRIMNNADGSGWSDLRFKTNAPESNGTMWTDGQGGFPGGVWNATTKGTWTITFNQDTNVVITAPGGGTVTNNFSPEVISIFTNYSTDMQINVGAVPGELNRVGQMAVVTGVKITGTPGQPDLTSSFLGAPPNPGDWGIIAQNPNGVRSILDDAAYWVNWTLPANGYYLQTTTTLNPGSWTDSTIPGYDAGGTHYSFFLNSDLPGTTSGYFRLIKRPFTKLQVLLPGETSAPYTASGKTGTPDAQSAGVPFNVTVNAVDEVWHVVSSTDTISITSSDTVATLPADAALVLGTATFSVTLNTSPGTWTVTATDVTDGTKTSNTSSPITVP